MVDPLEDLLAQYWTLREEGRAPSPAQFAARHPRHGARLRAALEALAETDALLPAGSLPGTIGDYAVERRIGRGANGEVFAVRAPDGRVLALKRLLPHAAATERARERLRREAGVLRELAHPGIVAVVDVGADAAAGDAPFVVMERVEGTTLAAIVARARTDGIDAACDLLRGPGDWWQRVARCIASVADALAASHGAGVLHRDLKPGNVLVRPDGNPVVIDFGLAADAGAATLTGTGDLLGTPHYMSPEQAAGREATAASDVFGLGALLFELLTLRAPRVGDDPLTVLEVARRTPAPRARTLAAEVPRDLDRIARRAMAFAPQHRFDGAAALARTLEQVADGIRPAGLTLSLSQRIGELWLRRRRSALMLAAGAVVATVAIWVVDLRAAANAERLQRARVAAFEARLDEASHAAQAAEALRAAGGDPALAAWLRDGTVAADAFVRALDEGARQMQHDATAAVAAFERAAAVRPGSALVAAWLGLAAERADDLQLAERELTAAVRALPDSLRLRTALGRLLRHQDRSAEAVVHLQHAAASPRAGDETWHELTKVLLTAGREGEALEAIEQALRRCDGARRRLTLLRTKAVVLDALERYEESLPILERLVVERPTRNVLTSYGIVLDRTHRIDEAAVAYRRVLERWPEDSRVLLNLAYLHAGSDPDCADCRAWFERHPELVDAALVDEYATRLLDAQAPDFVLAEVVAGYVRRVGGGAKFAAAVASHLERDLPAEALGRLLRARRVLEGR